MYVQPARGAWGVWKGLSGQREEEGMGATEELRMSPVVKDILALDFDGPLSQPCEFTVSLIRRLICVPVALGCVQVWCATVRRRAGARRSAA